MSSLSQDQQYECEKLFKFLDKDKDGELSSRELIIGLGVLGKTCTLTEQKKINDEYPRCDMDQFKSLCAEQVKFSEVDAGLVKAFNILESKEKPGYISQKDFIFVLKRLIENITDKDVNDIIKEVETDSDGYINLENIAREMLLK